MSDLLIIEDSLYTDSSNLQKSESKDNAIYTGIVREVIYTPTPPYVLYRVEVQKNLTNIIDVMCEASVRFGSPFNYEQVIHNGYKGSFKQSERYANNTHKAGTKVVISMLQGLDAWGVILGALCHDAREKSLKADDGVAYISEFNGIETTITSKGAYKMLFRGLPTNISELGKAASRPDVIPNPKYNTKIAGSYFTFLQDGSIILSDDNSDGKTQTIAINKTDGKVVIQAHNTFLFLDKNADIAFLNTSAYTVNAKENILNKTKRCDIESSQYFKVLSPKVSLGSTEVELLQRLVSQLEKVIDMCQKEASHTHSVVGVVTGDDTVTSDGPSTSGDWSTCAENLTKIKQDIDSIRGS